MATLSNYRKDMTLPPDALAPKIHTPSSKSSRHALKMHREKFIYLSLSLYTSLYTYVHTQNYQE